MPRYSRGAISVSRPVLLAASLALTAAGAPLRFGVVVGASMKPTLQPGQLFLYSPRRAGVPGRGEVVVLQQRDRTCVKRVHARGGESFWLVSGTPTERADMCPLAPGESIARWRMRFPDLICQKVEVPAGCVYVVGDAAGSLDSRTFGPVSLSDVQGQLIGVRHPEGRLRFGYRLDDLPPARTPRRRPLTPRQAVVSQARKT